jgi:hypothetical protein
MHVDSSSFPSIPSSAPPTATIATVVLTHAVMAEQHDIKGQALSPSPLPNHLQTGMSFPHLRSVPPKPEVVDDWSAASVRDDDSAEILLHYAAVLRRMPPKGTCYIVPQQRLVLSVLIAEEQNNRGSNHQGLYAYYLWFYISSSSGSIWLSLVFGRHN